MQYCPSHSALRHRCVGRDDGSTSNGLAVAALVLLRRADYPGKITVPARQRRTRATPCSAIPPELPLINAAPNSGVLCGALRAPKGKRKTYSKPRCTTTVVPYLQDPRYTRQRISAGPGSHSQLPPAIPRNPLGGSRVYARRSDRDLCEHVGEAERGTIGAVDCGYRRVWRRHAPRFGSRRNADFACPVSDLNQTNRVRHDPCSRAFCASR